MQFPPINYLAVLAAGVVIFLLGGLWYSPVLFAKKWIALQGRTEEQMRADAAGSSMPMMYVAAMICALLTAWVLAMFIGRHPVSSAVYGAHIGAVSWLGFAGPTSYATALFSGKSKKLWLIDSGYNLVSFILARALLGAWR